MSRPRYDFHMHSSASYDCLSSARGIVAAAKRRGLAGIAVTDHGTVAGSLRARDVARDLLIITGAEFYTEDAGDLLCLFIEQDVGSRKALEVIDAVHAQRGLVILPHPLKHHPKPIPAAVLQAVDGYEALNGRAGWFDAASAPATHGDWSLLKGKPATGSSDAHFTWEIGQAWTEIDGPATAANVREALVRGATFPGGGTVPKRDFYLSQFVKMVKTRDVTMLARFSRRLMGLGKTAQPPR